jgi:hypothetical protein
MRAAHRAGAPHRLNRLRRTIGAHAWRAKGLATAPKRSGRGEPPEKTAARRRRSGWGWSSSTMARHTATSDRHSHTPARLRESATWAAARTTAESDRPAHAHAQRAGQPPSLLPSASVMAEFAWPQARRRRSRPRSGRLFWSPRGPTPLPIAQMRPRRPSLPSGPAAG